MSGRSVLAVAGFARSGKDTLVQYLSHLYGVRRYALADPIRDALYALNPIVSCSTTGEKYRLQDVVDDEGWDDAKSLPEIRRLLQVFGTEVGREMFGDTVWIDKACDFIAEQDYVVAISDLRFLNEYDVLKSRFGLDLLTVKIKRPEVGPVNGHVSDSGLSDELFDVVIENDGSLSDLYSMAEHFVVPLLDPLMLEYVD